MTKDKDLVHEYFPKQTTLSCCDEGYEVVEEPFLGYRIHLCKRSAGWKPLFQMHDKAFRTFAELEKFYNEHEFSLTVFDEYERSYTFKAFKREMISHSEVERQPRKYVYNGDPLFELEPKVRNPVVAQRKTLHLEPCEPEEADLYLPYDHSEIIEAEIKARKKFGLAVSPWLNAIEYERDPDYNFDWVKGDFC